MTTASPAVDRFVGCELGQIVRSLVFVTIHPDRDQPVLCDRDLLDHPQVWSAAGPPTTVFALTPEDLVQAAAARVVDVAG